MIAIARTDSPILPLEPQAVRLDLQTIYDLTHLHARDRGIEYTAPNMIFEATSDPQGLFQMLLGLSLWVIQQTLYGSISIVVDGQTIIWTTAGKFKPLDHDHPYWQTPARLAQALGHGLEWQPETLSVICRL